MKAPERERRDWIIVFAILLFGFLCILVAGAWATRFAPSWRLNASMESMLDPNSDFLTNRPVGFVEPLDPSILTQPAWIDVFLTPGASFNTRIPLPTATATVVNTIPATNTSIPATKTPVPTIIIPFPTNTPVYHPPATKTSNPQSPTNTPVASTDTPVTPTNTPIPSADLQITKDDGVITYLAGSPITYTIVVANNGPNNVNAATVTDTFDATRLNNITWTCAYTGGASSACAGSGDINDTVNLPAGAAVTYNVGAVVNLTASSDLVNTASVSAGINDPNMSNNTATDTDTFVPSADLQITKDDFATTYSAGTTVNYTVTVKNNGPNDVTGATVSDGKPAQVLSWSWTCAESGGADGCAGITNGNSDFTNTVNLPNGASIIYTVSADIPSAPGVVLVSALTNTATVSVPPGITDPNPGNNSATDSDTPATTTTEPDIGPPDGNSALVQKGQSLVMLFSPAIVTGGNTDPDFVYYEVVARNNPFPQVDLDWVKIEISQDGNTWYQVFYWGDDNRDTNTNVVDVICPNEPPPPVEADNCRIPTANLYPYPGTGVTVDIDGLVPPGSYPWMRISSPAGSRDGANVDAIQPYYP